MQSRPNKKNRTVATRSRRVSLDLTDEPQSELLERKMMEAIERIERLRSKALYVGSMLAAAER
ncbi:MAG: hypothetical protein LC663_03990 [Actinobacteria bacterium]|nr:hypothetical protein [Actinomycetota bacterium]